MTLKISIDASLDVEGDISAFVKLKRDRMAFRIDKRLVMETAVDTSQASSNWIVSEGRGATSYQKISENNGGQGRADAQGAAAITKAKPYSVLYITNNVPYIDILNEVEGYSKKAPAHYIDRIVEEESRKE